jgi:TRAP-type C4-dicarboxylate transport system substrate-binding protein
MNYDKWNQLPADAKSYLQKAAEEMAEFDPKYASKVDAEIQESIKGKFKEIYTIPTSGSAYNEWVDPIRGIFLNLAVQKAGSRAQEYYDAIMEAKTKLEAMKK